MKHLFSIFCILILIGSVHAQQIDTLAPGYTRFYYEDGSLSSEGIISENKPDSYWKTYYPNGSIKSEGNRKYFNLEGVWVFFNNRGDTLEKINYRNDRKNGYYYKYEWQYKNEEKTGGLVSKELYVNDKLQNKSYYYYPGEGLYQVVNYKNDTKHGKAFEYNEEGRIIYELNYRQGVLTKRTKINSIDKNGWKQGLWREYYSNDRVKKESTYLNNELNGYIKEYDIRGQLKLSKRYFKGEEIVDDPKEKEEIQERIEYHNNGKIKKKGGFLKEKPVGVHRTYDEKGNVVASEVFSDEGNKIGEGLIEESGKRKGNWRSFYESGELKSEGTYKKGKRTGKWIYYFENGAIEQTGSFRNGKLDSKWMWYYDTGELWREEEYVAGREEGEAIEYSREGEIIDKGVYVDGLREGEWISRFGDHIEKGKYLQGEREGEWKFYYLNENPKFEGNFFQGNEDGKHRWYYENGNLKEERYYVNGSRERMWKYFNPDGTLFMTITYRNNKEIKINGKRIDEDESLK
jgi:antitoxin component YwqK of YwqJK toxin-antitoxin module